MIGVSKVNIGDNEGYKITYTKSFNEGNLYYIKAYLVNNDYAYEIQYWIPFVELTDSDKMLFYDILKSFKFE